MRWSSKWGWRRTDHRDDDLGFRVVWLCDYPNTQRVNPTSSKRAKRLTFVPDTLDRHWRRPSRRSSSTNHRGLIELLQPRSSCTIRNSLAEINNEHSHRPTRSKRRWRDPRRHRRKRNSDILSAPNTLPRHTLQSRCGLRIDNIRHILQNARHPLQFIRNSSRRFAMQREWIIFAVHVESRRRSRYCCRFELGLHLR